MKQSWAGLGQCALMLSLGLGLSGCMSSNLGGFLPGDGLPDSSVDISQIPNAVPKLEPLSKTGNKRYTVYGASYKPMTSVEGYSASGVASWYGTKFHGRRTSSGEPYDMFAMTAAHRTLPLPSYVRVTNLKNKLSVVVKVNDRGPFIDTSSRIMDLSYAAAAKLGIVKSGTGEVYIEAIVPGAELSTIHLEKTKRAHSGSVVDALAPKPAIVRSPEPAATAVPAERIPSANQQTSASSVATTMARPAKRLNEHTNKQILQIGAYSQRANAVRLKAKLAAEGLPSFIAYEHGLFKVQSGPYQRPETTIETKLRIDRLLSTQSKIITYRAGE